MSKPNDSLAAAAERWGLAAIRYLNKQDMPTTRMIGASRCAICKKWVAYGRGRKHILAHLKGTPLS